MSATLWCLIAHCARVWAFEAANHDTLAHAERYPSAKLLKGSDDNDEDFQASAIQH